jgi:hypothetical protein
MQVHPKELESIIRFLSSKAKNKSSPSIEEELFFVINLARICSSFFIIGDEETKISLLKDKYEFTQIHHDNQQGVNT